MYIWSFCESVPHILIMSISANRWIHRAFLTTHLNDKIPKQLYDDSPHSKSGTRSYSSHNMITHSHSDFGAGINLTRRLLLRRAAAAAHMTLEWDCDVVASAQHRLFFLTACCCILKYTRKEKKKQPEMEKKHNRVFEEGGAGESRLVAVRVLHIRARVRSIPPSHRSIIMWILFYWRHFHLAQRTHCTCFAW